MRTDGGTPCITKQFLIEHLDDLDSLYDTIYHMKTSETMDLHKCFVFQRPCRQRLEDVAFEGTLECPM